MNILDKILDFFYLTRQNGNTTLLKKISKENNVIILVATEIEKFDDNCIAVHEYDVNKIRGKNVPILTDNNVVIKILEHSICEIEKLQQDIMAKRLLERYITILNDSFDCSKNKIEFVKKLERLNTDIGNSEQGECRYQRGQYWMSDI